METFNKPIIFALLGFVASNTMIVAMEKDDKKEKTIIELEEQFCEWDLSDSESQMSDSDSTRRFTYSEIPERSLSTPPESHKEIIELKFTSQSEEQKIKKIRKRRPSLRKNILRQNFEYDLYYFKEAIELLFEGIKKAHIGKIVSAIELCPEHMCKTLLSEEFSVEENLNLNALSLLIGLHGKNFSKCFSILELLIKCGVSELHDCTLLHTAAFFNCPALIDYLLENKLVDPLKLGGENEKVSALHIALKYKCFDAAKALITFYSNKKSKKTLVMMINLQDSLLLTPLHYLLDQAFDSSMPIELECHGNKIAAVYHEIHSNLVQVDMVSMVKLLCELGADIDARDGQKRTPRYLAIEEGRKGSFLEVIDFYAEQKKKKKK